MLVKGSRYQAPLPFLQLKAPPGPFGFPRTGLRPGRPPTLLLAGLFFFALFLFVAVFFGQDLRLLLKDFMRSGCDYYSSIFLINPLKDDPLSLHEFDFCWGFHVSVAVPQDYMSSVCYFFRVFSFPFSDVKGHESLSPFPSVSICRPLRQSANGTFLLCSWILRTFSKTVFSF